MFAEEWKDYYGYKVSNYGRVINRFGREIDGREHNNGYKYWHFVLRIGGKRIDKPANTLIYELFGKGYRKGMTIHYIDGNPKNNRIDNLCVCKAYTEERTAEQVKMYEQNALISIKYILKRNGYIETQKKGYDIDNVIGDSLLLIWQYLPQWQPSQNFVSFCRKYVRIAFLKEWDYHKHYGCFDTDDNNGIRRWADA